MMRLTSSTAPGTYFGSREELAEHYHSDWHRYNLRRRQAGLKPVTSVEFQAKLSAARTVQLEKNNEKSRAHLKNKNKEKNKADGSGKTTDEKSKELRPPPREDDLGTLHLDPTAPAAVTAVEDVISTLEAADEEGVMLIGRDSDNDDDNGNNLQSDRPASTTLIGKDVLGASGDSDEAQAVKQEEQEEASSAPVEINPKRCLFDRHVSSTVHDNVTYMHRTFGFFVPDVEHLVDLPGLVGYCHEKILLGRTCLWCQHVFVSAEACVSHMKAKGHAKILYEAGVDLDEWDVFYDFTETNREFLSNLETNDNGGGASTAPEYGNDDDDEWEDVSDDDDDKADDDDHDDDDYRGYEEEVGKMGITVTDLGEIVFPDGRVVGHRSLRRYYKQNLAPYRQHKLEDASIAVRAARIAAGERLYKGRVYNVYAADNTSGPSGRALINSSGKMAAKMAAMGLHAPTGRAGQGILVPVSSSSASSSAALSTPLDYSKLSIYRYRAAVRKARYGEDYGRRLWLRSNTNLNRMDKKANRLANGMSVAHAAR